ncbi:DUF2183 domain-containing protein [Fulvivirga sp. 29W222]|uniref:DUF2183 domain-containing protein n=1 Tax=Fulvivirga marina TaxID=2494733 RepID=A0A937G083_9BACT|nr:phosphatase domain-containing protein [Fulvivirga marina]MBL6446111.1 DUF2183 domain-containing protein [Fulvivirga marina]
MLSRYMSSPIPDVRVGIFLFDQECIVETDENGYFEKDFMFNKPLAISGWHKVRYKVLDKIVEEQEELEVEGEVYIHRNGEAKYGVISDVDDTILISHATKILSKLRLILTKNSKTRLPFTGVAAFYNALHHEPGRSVQNPVFYVSSSEWNLYDFLEDFCEVRNIPKGPFLLQDLKTSLWKLIKSGGGNHYHKLEKIKHLMLTFEDMPFILIGDSGQRDSLLYAEITRQFPERVKAIYIRDVSKSRKDEKVNAIARELLVHNVEMLLVADTEEAARHAYENGLITREEMLHVVEETRGQSLRPTSLVGQLVRSESHQHNSG